MKQTNEQLSRLLLNNTLLDKSERELYTMYTINKRDGSKRTICKPIDELSKLQKSLVPIIKQFPVSKYATAYETKTSCKKNAMLHIKAKHILHIDIKDFFQSITCKMVGDLFGDKITPQIANKLYKAISFNGGIPIGAATSPFIANRVLFEMDKELNKIGLFIKYSRYSDDMIFSSFKHIKAEIIDKINKILAKYGFKINKKKTYFMKSRKEITGIIINNKKLSTGTSYKKKLKSDIYNYLVNGIGYKDIILGKISYLNHIEPEYAKKIIKKYKSLDNVGLFKNHD